MPGSTVVYREGTIGRPSSINPLTARTQADRDLVCAHLQRPRRARPGRDLRPDLASDWTVDPTGATWTFTHPPGRDLAGRRAGDGRRRRCSRSTSSRAPATPGPLAASWRRRDRDRRRRADGPLRAGDADRRVPPGGDDRSAAGAPPERGGRRDAGRRSVQRPAGRLRTVRAHVLERRVGHARPGERRPERPGRRARRLA